MKKIILANCILLSCNLLFSQTLFTYGNKAVSKHEFVQAFDKNPSADTASRNESLKNYLDLYIRYKLKVQAAYDEKMNESDEYKSEADNFKKELAETAINNEANLNSLVREAFLRSQKDIQLAQIFIPVATGKDSSLAFAEINKAYDLLKNGKSFHDVLLQFSTDSITKQNDGNIGYITVFTLPYEAENMVYHLHPGEFAKPYHSRIGYHIFKEISERKAVGSRSVQSVLFPVSPAALQSEKARVKTEADSVYQLIKNGVSFTGVQAVYNVKKSNNQNPIEVSVGEYSPDFETEVFALQKEGDVSKPFATAYGYNIIKLIQKNIVVDTNDIVVKAAIQQKVVADDRLSEAKQKLVENWLKATGYQPSVYNKTDLWIFTDSALSNGTTIHLKKLTNNTVLFSFAKKKITVADWLRYLQMKMAESKARLDYTQLMPQFIHYATTIYYKDHIEEFHPELKPQLSDFNDANLLFAAMDKHVWNKASTDTAGLLKYYNAHSEKYKWAPGADAIIITANNKQIAEELSQKIKEKPADWRAITDSFGSLAQADSNRFEKNQLPVTNAAEIKENSFAEPAQKSDAGNYTLVYITKIYEKPEKRTFNDAKGMVINDYQQVVENNWIAGLKKKYPVKINDAVFAGIQ